MVVKAVVQMGLNWKRLIQELLKKVFLGGLAQNDAFAICIFIGTTCTTTHLQHISNWVVLIGMDFAIVELRVHDNYEMGPHIIKRPAEISTCHSNLDRAGVE